MLLKNVTLRGIFDDDDIDHALKRYMSMICPNNEPYPFKPMTKVYTRTLELEKDVVKDRNFWKREKDRWRYGHDGLAGMMYGAYNYWPIKKAQGGTGLPDMRRYMNELLHLVESIVYDEENDMFPAQGGLGINALGKRRVGKSVIIGVIMYSLILHFSHIDIGLTSKTEKDIKKFIQEKIKTSYNLLPMPLKVTSQSGNSKMEMHFAKKMKDAQGNAITKGKNNSLLGRAPGAETWESTGLKALFFDEAPKTANFKEMLKNSVTCLVGDDTISREGLLFITGVAGDFDKFGEDSKDIWRNPKVYDLINYFIAGWVGMCADEKGNEDVEQAVRGILQRRKDLRNSSESEQINFMQQYPLTPDEAFLSMGGTTLPIKKISAQLRIRENSQIQELRGGFEWNQYGESVIWRPSKSGKILLLEHPKAEYDYSFGLDSYDLRESKDGSQGSMIGIKEETEHLSDGMKHELYKVLDKQTGGQNALMAALDLGMLPVMTFMDAPPDPDEYAEIALMILIYWRQITGQKHTVLMERKPSTIIKWFIDNNFEDFLSKTPRKATNKRPSGEERSRYGLLMNEYWAEQRRKYLFSFFNTYSKRVWIQHLLDSGLVYDDNIQAKKKDDIDGLGLALIDYHAKKIRNFKKRGRRRNSNSDEPKKFMPGFKRNKRGFGFG